ncbi:MAG: DUF1640 domain-containing protein [SAR324 cluster bacterium]|nr:DUF1640 domain-containing protein [SAR324 cluster bacterium]
MAATILFDTHAYVKKLKEAGASEKQAEVHAQALADLVNDKLATKQDLRELELRMTVRLGAIVTVGIGVVAVLVKIL